MKKYIAVFLLTAVLITSMILSPEETKVEIVTPKTMNFTETITVTGILEEQKKRDMILSTY